MSNAAEIMAGVRSASLQVQEADPERDARVERASRDPLFFARTYLPHYFTDEPCGFHRELIRLLFENSDDLVVAAPRGHAKSTITALLYPLHQVLFKRRHYIPIVRKTMTDAEEAIDCLRKELETNKQILADFGQVVKRGKTRSILLNTDALIVAKTRGSKIRGTRYRQYRPDLIICDDLEDDQHIESKEQRESDEKWFNSAISNAVAPGGRTVIIGTVLHAHSLLSKLLANATYVRRIFRAVVSWPEETELWEKWREIYQDIAQGKDAALEFFRKHRQRMLAGAEVLWPSRFPFYDLMRLREKIGSLSFSQELQNNPVDPDSQLVKEEWIRYYEESELENLGLTMFGACDPSISKKQTADDSAIVSVARASNGILYVRDCDASRRSMLGTTSVILRKSTQYQYAGFAIEVVAYQAALAENVMAESVKQKVYVPVIALKNPVDKRTRFASISPLIENGTIRFLRSQRKLVEQLVGFPKWDHDDCFDGLEMAVRLARGGGGPIEFFGSGRPFKVLELEEDGHAISW